MLIGPTTVTIKITIFNSGYGYFRKGSGYKKCLLISCWETDDKSRCSSSRNWWMSVKSVWIALCLHFCPMSVSGARVLNNKSQWLVIIDEFEWYKLFSWSRAKTRKMKRRKQEKKKKNLLNVNCDAAVFMSKP